MLSNRRAKQAFKQVFSHSLIRLSCGYFLCLQVGVVTKPFGFEGRKRMTQASAAIAELQGKVDTLIVVSNDKLLQIVPAGTPLMDSFLVADDILRQVGTKVHRCY